MLATLVAFGVARGGLLRAPRFFRGAFTMNIQTYFANLAAIVAKSGLSRNNLSTASSFADCDGRRSHQHAGADVRNHLLAKTFPILPSSRGKAHVFESRSCGLFGPCSCRA